MGKMIPTKNFLLGIFDDEAAVLSAVKTMSAQRVAIHDVYTPYAVHGLDEAMGIRRSRLPYVTFLAGGFGFLLALLFQTWAYSIDWPVNVGGKPYFALPAFVPIIFELTVLIGGLVTVAAFFVRARLRPRLNVNLIEGGITDNRFVIAVEKSGALDVESVGRVLRDNGAREILEKQVVS